MRMFTALIISLIACSHANASDFRWTTGFTMGTVEAIIRNENDSSVNIYCPSGQIDTTPGMFIEVSKVRPKSHEEIAVQVIVDGKNYPFYLDEIQFKASGRARFQSLYSLIDALASARDASFIVEFPKFGMAERFSLLDAKKALASAREFLESCGS